MAMKTPLTSCILRLLSLGLIVCSPASAVFGQNETTIAVFSETAPTLDGVVDSAWSVVPWSTLDKAVSDFDSRWVTPSEEFGARFKMLWNLESVFVLVEVTDDIVATRTVGGNAWQDDSVELFFDLLDDGGVMDTLSMQVYFRALDDDEFYFSQAGAMPILDSQYDRESVLTDDGYRIEVRVDWSNWGVDALDLPSIGFDIYANDGDVWSENPILPARLSWSNPDDNNFQQADDYGSVELLFEAPVESYGPYTISEESGLRTIETKELGLLEISLAPWLYHPESDLWIHAEGSAFVSSGAWIYFTDRLDSLVDVGSSWSYHFDLNTWMFTDESLISGSSGYVFIPQSQ